MPRRTAEKKGFLAGRLFSSLLGFACALVLIAIFYGAMVYQLGGDARHIAPAGQGAALLAVGGAQLTGETAQDASFGGENGHVVTRTYALSGGGQATAISAQPAAYLSRLSAEGWESQLIAGFTLAGMDAVYLTRVEQGMLAARDGERVYLLTADVDEAAMYALGASAYLE